MHEMFRNREIAAPEDCHGPMDFEKIRHFLGEGCSRNVSLFFTAYRTRIHRLLLDLLSEEPLSTYRNFLLHDPEGNGRVVAYLDSFQAALDGEIDTFLDDQKEIGYVRAMEGYHLNDVYGYTMAFKQAIWNAILEYNEVQSGEENLLDNGDIFALHKLLDCAFYLLALSFVQTRDEIIMRHRDQLQALQRYTAEAVSIFDDQKIRAHATQGIHDIYGLFGTFLVREPTGHEGQGHASYKVIGLQVPHDHVVSATELMSQSPRLIGLDDAHMHVDLSGNHGPSVFRFVCAPIQDRNSVLTGILFVHDQGRVFHFSKFDCDLLSQFAYFTGAVSANSRMISEIADNQKDLRNLTARLISVQEEERKRISADIHDVITQALTGMGYKALFCMGIVDKDTEKLKSELNLLTVNINEALHQSRQIIRNLRPHILDDIGIIPAFRDFTGDFARQFHLDIHFSHPDRLDIAPDKGIGLFRILQEALHNIQRHARASRVEVYLELEGVHRVCLRILDNGRGFDSRMKRRYQKGSGLGLLTMRERAEDLAGSFHIYSRPGLGCEITVKVPLE